MFWPVFLCVPFLQNKKETIPVGFCCCTTRSLSGFDCVEIQCNSIIKIKMLIYPKCSKATGFCVLCVCICVCWFFFGSSTWTKPSSKYYAIYVNGERRCCMIAGAFWGWILCEIMFFTIVLHILRLRIEKRDEMAVQSIVNGTFRTSSIYTNTPNSHIND